MEFFVWNDNLRTGNAFIDHDHRHLIALINGLYIEMQNGHGPSVVGPALNDLIQYTREHFKREEEEMKRIHYADFPQHKEEHDKLTREVLEFHKRFTEGKSNMSVGLLMFLYDWLFEHILNVDTKLAQAIQACPGNASTSPAVPRNSEKSGPLK